MAAKITTNIAWLLLVVAGVLEVVWAISMKSPHGFTKQHFDAA
jgi:multidrug transporter EmrE-like cation transporter